MNFSEKAYVNKNTIVGYTLIDIVLFAAYVLEFIKGARSLGYLAVIAVLTIGPVVAEWIIYKKAAESVAIRYVMGVCYSLFYLFCMLTTTSDFVFVYALPLFVVIILYADVAYCIAISAVCFIFNLISVGYYAVAVGIAAEELPDLEIRLACMGLIAIFLVRTTICSKKVNQAKLNRLNEQQEVTNKLMEEILTTSDSMMKGIVQATDKMEALGVSVEHIQNSMGEVSTGSNETAEAIQTQMQQTEQIQNHIVTVKNTTAVIEENMKETAQKVEVGREQMEALAQQVAKSMDANEQVLQKMEELERCTKQMNTIIETITSIAGSTGMLALNASIEAARAGEAGRGFAVVAGEISGLANQTKQATVNITSLIEDINKELHEVAAAVAVVTESNQANADSTGVVTQNFAGIAEGTDNIGRQTRDLLSVVQALETANADIVEKIQTISAITEEVSAHSSETYDACEENAKMVVQVNQIVMGLNTDAQKLKNIR